MTSCLTCGESYSQEDKHLDKAQASDRFTNLCVALRLSIAKSCLAWDFDKEVVPLCPTCAELIDRCGTILQRLRSLEEDYSGRVGQLKKRLEKCGPNPGDDRVQHFRQLALGLGVVFRGKKRGRPKREVGILPTPMARPSLDAVLQDNFNSIKNALSSEDENEVEAGSCVITTIRPSSSTRRLTSRQKSIRRSKNRTNAKNGDKSESNADLFPIIKEETLGEVDARNFVDTELDIKQEFDDSQLRSDWEEDCFLEQDDQDEDDIPLAKRMENIKRTSRTTRNRKVGKTWENLSSESEDFSDPDFDLGLIKSHKKRKQGKNKDPVKDNLSSEEDESDEDDELSDERRDEGDVSQRIRKWKINKKKGQMWYNGIPVILVSSGLQCSICSEIIPGDKAPNHRLRVKNHIITKHLANFSCPICSKKLSAQKYLELHIQRIHEKSICVPCPVCEKPFTSCNAMKRHSWSHLNAEEKLAAGRSKSSGDRKSQPLKCGVCGKICNGSYRLKMHEETHLNADERQKHMCQMCGSIFSSEASLRSHIKMQHENNNRLQWLQCPHCPAKFPQNARLKKHMFTHTGERPHTCDKCGASFINSNLLKVHLYKHENFRPHRCQYCDMAFYRNYHLTRHTQVYHLNANPPKRKLPYRSENGTRKPPQKRDKRKVSGKNPSDLNQTSDSDGGEDDDNESGEETGEYSVGQLPPTSQPPPTFASNQS